MDIRNFEWNAKVVEKVIQKHGVFPHEVEEVFQGRKKIRAHAGVYHVLGRSKEGKYLFVVFRRKVDSVKIITARPMTESEKKLYRR